MSLEKINDSKYTNHAFTIISVGRIDPVKRFCLIPQIAKQLLAKGCHFKWYILGSNDCSGEFKLLRNNIEKCGINDTVIWLGNKNNPYPYFAQSN